MFIIQCTCTNRTEQEDSWCYWWNTCSLLLIKFTYKVTSLLWVWNASTLHKVTGNSKLNESRVHYNTCTWLYNMHSTDMNWRQCLCKILGRQLGVMGHKAMANDQQLSTIGLYGGLRSTHAKVFKKAAATRSLSKLWSQLTNLLGYSSSSLVLVF